MKVAWIEDAKDKELQYAWNELVDPVNRHNGETWQYIATEFHDTWKHVFRHRCHPATGSVMFVMVPATNGWRPRWYQEIA